MKRFVLALLLLATAAGLTAGEHKMISRYNRLTGQTAVYPEVSVQYIQEVHQDSLVIADALQNTIPSRWTLQVTPAIGDTVVITALCVVPGKVLTFTATGYTMLLHDTAAVNNSAGLLLRANTADSSQYVLDGFLNVERGDVIKITGFLAEFPTTSMNSLTQFTPVPGIAIDIIGSQPVPAPLPKPTGDFYTGIFPGGSVKYTTGEPLEGMMVELTHLTVDARVNTARGTFSMIDESGNQITVYDASRYFTLGHGTIIGPADPVWAATYPTVVVGTQIDTIRGFITTVSGGENPRGYRIAPVYYGDIVIGITLPSVASHRRNPILVPSDSSAKITVRVTQQTGGFPIDSVELFYSLDNGAPTPIPMLYDPADSLYHAEIPLQPANTFVSYFVKATDDQNNSAILASSAFGGASSDTSKGTFFYTVLDRPLTIHDVQYTPYRNGRTAYLAAVLSLSGIVTADTANIGFTALNGGGTSALYMQTGDQPWSGIWITGPESTMVGLRNGDSVTVTGSVAENFDVTRLQNISSAVVHSTGNPIPLPIALSTGTFNPIVSNGDPGAEPYEGMLVRFINVRVSDVYPVFADATEYELDDNSGPVIVRRDGVNNYSNLPADTLTGKSILFVNDRITSVTGIMYYSFNRYKVVPRTNGDFGTITDVSENPIDILPAQFALSQNYPNPFNPTTRFQVSLPEAAHIEVDVFNVVGQKIATLLSEERSAGNYTITWNGVSQNGTPATSGVYFVRMQAGSYKSVRKVLLMK